MLRSLIFLFVVFLGGFAQVLPGQVTKPTPAPTTTPAPGPDFSQKPSDEYWPRPYNSSNPQRQILGDWLLNGNWSRHFGPGITDREYEYEGYDGWYNNFARPDLGAIDRPLLRRWPAAYEDGSYSPSGSDRPNPLELSEKLLSGPTGSTSSNGKNALLVFFGQQVVEEILDAQRPGCPPEYFNIKIPDGHRYKVNPPYHSEMPFLRSRYDQRTGYSPNNPRQQLNEITPYIDGGLFYGITKQWADQLRTYKNGTVDPDGCLASSHDGLFPEYNTDRLPMANPPPPFYHSLYVNVHETAKVSRFFKLGNPRGNENAFLLTFGVMWFRWHNYLAKRLRAHNPHWTSDKVFNEARKWTIATQQHIIIDEWLPSWVPAKRVPKYEKYDPSVDPQIDQFFQAAAFRFGHTLVVPGVYLRDYVRNGCKHKFSTWGKNTVRTCNIFWRPQEPMLNHTDSNENELIDIDRLLMGMSVQLCEREDNKIVEDLRGNVFGPLEFPRRDLMAVNIQRGRDHGLPDYNTARKAFGLKYNNFEIIKDFPSVTPEILADLRRLYKNRSDNIDPWIGGILETRRDGPGELFETVIIDQFNRIRNGDRFWYENLANGLFTKNEVNRIKSIRLYDIIMAVTKMDPWDIPKNPFRVATDQDTQLYEQCKLMVANGNNTKAGYHFLPPLTQEVLNESCVDPLSYDYFSNSEASYILTFIGIGTFIVGAAGIVFLLINLKEKHKSNLAKMKIVETTTNISNSTTSYPLHIVEEWLGKGSPVRRVIILFKSDIRQIAVNNYDAHLLRALDFKTGVNHNLKFYTISDSPIIIIKSDHNYDLVVKFESDFLRNKFVQDFENFVSKTMINREIMTNFTWNAALKIVITKEHRQKRLEQFFRVVFAQAFGIDHSKTELLQVDAEKYKEIVETELTISEFADSLSMRASNEFVQKMFALIDKDRNGFISFREFIDLLIIFANGTEEEKAKLLFDMYDVNHLGYLNYNDFVLMIKSFLETVEGKVDEANIQKTVMAMMKSAGVGHKETLTFIDFKKMIGRDIQNLNAAKLGFTGVRKEDRASYLHKARETIEDIYGTAADVKARIHGNVSVANDPRAPSQIIDQSQEKDMPKMRSNTKHRIHIATLRFIELKSKEIFWLSLYTLVLLAIFAERAYYYSVEREHSGLRQIAGYGVTITRGAASAMMFTYSSLLVTMCRNSITYLRETVANKYFPFDASVDFHKYIAVWAFFFTVLHIVGHAFNFYHISTQTSDDLTCLFRNYFHSTHEIPKFHYWCWQTMTGFTGVVLTLIWAVMYIFAQKIVRAKIYNWFWYTHSLYPFFFIFMILHGTGRLIQPPFTYYFLLGPIILFTIDNLISISRKKVEIPVMKAEILPSNVTMLEFKKPFNFDYKAGQWVRIACMELNKHEYHPFTLSSAPNQKNLTVHIRAVGPWTTLIRTLYDNSTRTETILPKLYLDGPYGEGHQDWNLYDVAILIGGGIGVTPFASILKDVSYLSQGNQTTQCKKVYFIWVSRTQKQFEWLVDIIRDVEAKDTNLFVSCHIFITQFYEKFDLRTVLLYICERHYQRISNRSLFTNLRAVTHFGRPLFSQFFHNVQSIHESAQRIGVFSCGPPSMTRAVESACTKMNQQSNQRFEHHFKNF